MERVAFYLYPRLYTQVGLLERLLSVAKTGSVAKTVTAPRQYRDDLQSLGVPYHVRWWHGQRSSWSQPTVKYAVQACSRSSSHIYSSAKSLRKYRANGRTHGTVLPSWTTGEGDSRILFDGHGSVLGAKRCFDQSAILKLFRKKKTFLTQFLPTLHRLRTVMSNRDNRRQRGNL